MDSDLLKDQLESQINITRIMEIKPNSSLLVVCQIANLNPMEYEQVAKTIEEKLSTLLKGHKVVVIMSSLNLELDFYRIDQVE